MYNHNQYGSGYGSMRESRRSQSYESFTPTAVSSDTISVEHRIEFCKPVPVEIFECLKSSRAPATNCGVFTRDLKDYPLDDLPSGGECTNTMRISTSEMCQIYVELNNYTSPSSGTITHTWKNKDTGVTLFSVSFTVPEPQGLDWWWFGSWSMVGKFSWEIVTPGNYQCVITTSWGNATVDFVVIDTTPPETCTIQSGSFTVNGSSNILNCNTNQNETVAAECTVQFPTGQISKQYKAEFNITLVDVGLITLYSPLKTISSVTETFVSSDFVKPLSVGMYTLDYITIYDSVGKIIGAEIPVDPNCNRSISVNKYCNPNWQCETPRNGYETDGCGNRRANPSCNPVTCETPLCGYTVTQ